MSRQDQTTSGSESPIRTLFDVQRTAARQSEQAIKQGMQAQDATSRLMRNGFRMQETLQRQSLEVAQAATHSYMGIMNAMVGATGAADQRRTVDETFARLKNAQREVYETVDRELQRGIESYDDLSDEYFDALDQQTTQLMEATDTLEDQSAEGFDQFNRQLREQLERTQEIQDELEQQFEESTEQAEQLLRTQAEQTEEFRQQVERQGERMRQGIEESGERAQQMAPVQQGDQAAGQEGGRTAELPADEGGQPALDDIPGIGTATLEDLQDAGIDNVEALADADPEEVAEATATSEDRAQEWIDEAAEYVGQTA